MLTIDFLNERKQETNNISDILRNEFEKLEPAIFFRKPSTDKWSIGECINHLNLTLDIYIPQMVKITENKHLYPNQDKEFRYSPIGKMAVRSMMPKPNKTIPFKMKTFNKLTPIYLEKDKFKVISDFLKFQESILKLIDGCEGMNLTKPKIVTAAGPILKMRIGDALHFIVAHNQRHILQAQNVLKNMQ